ncbi:MAG: pirin family protein [Pasteurellaceae bacterium]|nr:pirin family protein [Pasteurellaceae bacterium]
MLQIRRANERGQVNHGWLNANHSFSFGRYYDPNWMGFSDLRVINEDRIAPNKGFGMHPHDNMEILTYVLSGCIEHQDSMGNIEQVPAGEFQIMSAGSGVYHSEVNPSDRDTLHLYQIWILPNEQNIAPRYAQRAFPDQIGGTLILSPNAQQGSFKVYQDMYLWRYQYDAQQQVEIALNPQRAYWLQVVKGELSVNGVVLNESDALAFRQETLAQITTSTQTEFLLFDLA